MTLEDLLPSLEHGDFSIQNEAIEIENNRLDCTHGFILMEIIQLTSIEMMGLPSR